MPRVNPLRPMSNEANLAKRIALERTSREWSYEGLAKRMTDSGFPIQGSAIFKIEKGDPPRRITVDELVGFAKVFGIAIDDLLRAIEVKMTEDAQRAFINWFEARERYGAADAEFKQANADLQEAIADHPESAASVATLVRMWREAVADPNVDEAVEYFMLGFRQATREERQAHIKKWSS